MKKFIFVVAILIFGVSLQSQDKKQPRPPSTRDTIIVYENPPDFKLIDTLGLRKAWGIDLSVANNGFAFGTFYRYQLKDVYFLQATLNFMTAKDKNEVEYIDPWTGQTFVPNKVNRILVLPLSISLQYRLFKDELADNLRPFLMAGTGPTLIFTTPYEKEFFSSLKYGKAHYTVNFYIGVGAYIGLDPRTISGLSIRYYFIPYSKGIESLRGRPIKEFGGINLTLTFGISF
ncbi:Outer membrane protein beta-barrel domain [Candidatus Kryptobacter tengchongensis]|uniref:Outer membrane protein beta-barrel domain n=2 Tax=Kryptobacter tengchongensis TaxID=1643429 RepID=A0A916LKP9_KRYT1|nr:Outer membrane protein beta-barrel domain [Candidatus Kryptobacter tengchongensis]CUU05291.1 Outer membrane protein beta-barrel domain [Candidatus Kryptobacter tengchongensis]